MDESIKIYHDFQKTDDERRLILSLNGTTQDLQKYKITLAEGLELTFWGDDLNDTGQPDPLIAEGVVTFNKNINEWVAKINWDNLKHESELNTLL